MRLICPNCGAQYEVDDEVIPENGRDVQCSNCGHTWYQRPASRDRELAEEMGLDLPEDEPEEDQDTGPDEDEDEVDDHIHDDEDRPHRDADDDSDETVSDEDEDEDEDTEAADDADDEAAHALAAGRRKLDDGIAGILREEAERETAEREGERSVLETQTEMGLDAEASRAERAARRTSGGSDEDGEEAPMAVAPSNRRELLPDIEEINSTLTASKDREEEDAEERQERRERSGFRRGFIIAVLIFAILALVYAYAPRIVDAYPAAEPALSAYVDAVNGLRLWIDGLMQIAVEKLTALLGQFSGNGA